MQLAEALLATVEADEELPENFYKPVKRRELLTASEL
jgi:hypothetical protein